MPITKYDPFAELADFPKLFDTFSRMLEPAGRPWVPAVDILETEDELVLKADIPDVSLKDIDIHIENGTLTLKGERKFEAAGDGNHRGYHRIERSFGSFARYFTLPDSVDPEKVKAEYKNGVLTVMLPKKEVAKPRTIKVEVSNN